MFEFSNMKTSCLLIVALLCAGAAFTGAARASGIVCRYDSTDIEIKRDLTAVIKIYRDYEIRTEEGLSLTEFAVPVNNYIEFSDLKGFTELSDGKKIKIGRDDFMIFTGRMDREFGGKKAVIFSLKSPAVGARLHYQYRLDIKSLLYLPRIVRQDPYPVDRMAVRLRWPGNIELFYDSRGFEDRITGRKAIFFANGLPEVHEEQFACDDDLYLFLSANRFKFGGEKYRCDSWQDVGVFFNDISRQPDPSIVAVRRLGEKLLENSVTFDDTLKSLFDFVATRSHLLHPASL